MADSNRCHGQGHVFENRELSRSNATKVDHIFQVRL